MNIHSNADFVVSHLLDMRWFLIDCTGLVDDGATHNGKFLGIFLSIFHLGCVVCYYWEKPKISSKCPSFRNTRPHVHSCLQVNTLDNGTYVH